MISLLQTKGNSGGSGGEGREKTWVWWAWQGMSSPRNTAVLSSFFVVVPPTDLEKHPNCFIFSDPVWELTPFLLLNCKSIQKNPMPSPGKGEHSCKWASRLKYQMLTVTSLLLVKRSFTVSLDDSKIPRSSHCLPPCLASLSGCSVSLFCVKCVVFQDELLHRALVQESALWLLLEKER